MIGGTVRSTFQVRADGPIQVQESVEDAVIETQSSLDVGGRGPLFRRGSFPCWVFIANMGKFSMPRRWSPEIFEFDGRAAIFGVKQRRRRRPCWTAFPTTSRYFIRFATR